MVVALARRSMLFVPGMDERKVRKALSIPADSIILDLEDSVPVTEKDRARDAVVGFLRDLDWGSKEVCVRINSIYTENGLRDLIALSRADRVDCIVVPKAESDLSFIYRLTGIEIVPIVETAKGFISLESIATSEGVSGITWGPADLALSVGGDLRSFENSSYIRIRLALVANAYGIDPIDKVYFGIDDLEGFRRDCIEAKKMGYIGKTVVHPAQVEVANQVFTPSREEVEWAKEVVEVYEQALKTGRGAVKHRNQLIDAVHYRIARRILERASTQR